MSRDSKMRSILPIILLILSSTNAFQNDQAIMTVSNQLNPFILIVSSAIVINDHDPLRIVLPANINFDQVQALDAVTIPTEPQIIDVLHPTILESFPNLFHLNLWNVGMRRITQDSFRNCTLQAITLAVNLLQEIPAGVFRNCGNVLFLTLNRNRITTITPESFQGLGNLINLNLFGNQISTITADLFAHIPLVTSINFGLNSISELPPRAFPSSIQTLDLAEGHISNIHPEAFENLQSLNNLFLDGNPISLLVPNVFANLTSLFQLSLSRTGIRRLNSNSFRNLPILTNLLIQSSAFDELQHGFFNNFPSINRFDTRNNTCADVSLEDVRSIDFNENTALHRCFANWFVPNTP